MPDRRPAARLPLRAMILRGALGYLGVVFAVAFALGILRVTLIAPRLGDVGAVLLEVPIVWAVSWVVAGRILRRWPVATGGTPALLGMGALAFLGLMLLEAGLDVWVFGRPWGAYLAAFATPAGAIGLLGQIGFALIPWLRGR